MEYKKLEDWNPEKWPKANSSWIDDSEMDFCAQCKTPFGCCNRKHHCRRCGFIYCQSCTTHQRSISGSLLYSQAPTRVCDMCYDYEAKRDYFMDQQLPMLQKGALFAKTPPTLGTIRKRIVRLTDDKKAIIWHPEKEQPIRENYLPLDEIVQISRGQNTEPFRRYGDPSMAKLSFSICATSRTLDLSAANDTMLKDWVLALEAMLIFIPRKVTPVDKRKEQRKNDKMEEKAVAIQKKKEERTKMLKNIKDKYSS